MLNSPPDIAEKDFLTSPLLSEAGTAYAQTPTQTFQPSTKAAKTPLEALSLVGQSLTQLQTIKNNRENLIAAQKTNILNLIKKAELTAYGFKAPRALTDIPIKIPADLFFTANINWQNSELEFETLKFTGIRIVKINSPEILQLQSTTPEIPTIQKKPNFSELDPELHINEKDAAELLGISHRTLQKYRTQGGGPKFLKLKKAVRYKIADLLLWQEGCRKNNTSS